MCPRYNAFLHIRYRSVDVIQSFSPQPVKDRVPVVRYLATHPPDRRRSFPVSMSPISTWSRRSPSETSVWWLKATSRWQCTSTRSSLNAFAVHWRHRYRCEKPDLSQNWLLQYHLSGSNPLVPGLHRTRCNVVCKCKFIISKNGTKYNTMNGDRYTVRYFERQPVS